MSEMFVSFVNGESGHNSQIYKGNVVVYGFVLWANPGGSNSNVLSLYIVLLMIEDGIVLNNLCSTFIVIEEEMLKRVVNRNSKLMPSLIMSYCWVLWKTLLV